MKKFNIKLPSFKFNLKFPNIKLNIKKTLKGIGKIILNTFTIVVITGGGILAFSSYINPVPTIASYLPDLQYGNYTLETLVARTRLHSMVYIRWYDCTWFSYTYKKYW